MFLLFVFLSQHAPEQSLLQEEFPSLAHHVFPSKSDLQHAPNGKFCSTLRLVNQGKRWKVDEVKWS